MTTKYCVDCNYHSPILSNGDVMCTHPTVCEVSIVTGKRTAKKASLARDTSWNCGKEGKFFELIPVSPPKVTFRQKFIASFSWCAPR